MTVLYCERSVFCDLSEFIVLHSVPRSVIAIARHIVGNTFRNKPKKYIISQSELKLKSNRLLFWRVVPVYHQEILIPSALIGLF